MLRRNLLSSDHAGQKQACGPDVKEEAIERTFKVVLQFEGRDHIDGIVGSQKHNDNRNAGAPAEAPQNGNVDSTQSNKRQNRKKWVEAPVAKSPAGAEVTFENHPVSTQIRNLRHEFCVMAVPKNVI